MKQLYANSCFFKKGTLDYTLWSVKHVLDTIFHPLLHPKNHPFYHLVDIHEVHCGLRGEPILVLFFVEATP